MKRSRQLLTSRGGGELIELQMTIRIEGGSIRSKGRRPRNGTFILPLSPSPVFLPLPTNESWPGRRPAFHRPLITFPQRASIIIRIVFESRAGDPRGERRGVSHTPLGKSVRHRDREYFGKTFSRKLFIPLRRRRGGHVKFLRLSISRLYSSFVFTYPSFLLLCAAEENEKK